MSSPLISQPLARPPEASASLLRLTRLATRPLERFLQLQAASGIVLLIAAAVALIWANSPWAGSYVQLWHTPIGLRIGDFSFERPLEWLINDGLMVIFFFVVGLEIRRELAHGELSEFRRALLPAGAALGGMLVPALVYLAIAGDAQTRSGWGVPTATDIAFAVGILALLGPRVPPALRVLLLALAVIDDLGAIVVIGLFYSSGISFAGLGIAVVGLAIIFVMQRLGVRSPWLYVLPGFVVWAGIASAGIHPTIAGVLVGLATPVQAWLGPGGFLVTMKKELEQLTSTSLSSHEFADRLNRVSMVRREALSPAESLLETLHPYVAFGIMPLFALANAGVAIGGVESTQGSVAAAVGVAMGLVIGKPIGVLLACAVLLRFKLAILPVGVGWRHLVVLGAVAGIGFTMALFVAQLAFSTPSLLGAARLGILSATAIASVLALVLGRTLLPKLAPSAAKSADEAESSTTH